MANILNKLTEGIVNRNVQREGEALLDKWSKTGLLEGISDDHGRQSMACLLENQAKELLREANSNAMSNGGIEGFAAVSFPIVRRVFGGLLANDLVSVQPMSLPSGLIFFLDFTTGDARGPYAEGTSVYGGGVKGSEITEGVGDIAETGFYALSQGYSNARGTSAVPAGNFKLISKFTLNKAEVEDADNAASINHDADLVARGVEAGTATTEEVAIIKWSAVNETTALAGGDIAQIARNAATSLSATFASNDTGEGGEDGTITGPGLIRRLTKVDYVKSGASAGAVTAITLVLAGDLSEVDATTAVGLDAATAAANGTGDSVGVVTTLSYAITDNLADAGMGALKGTAEWELESSLESPFADDGMNIPEIDIKVDSVAITAQTRKLKAKWTPELGQDLNAYHNLDAEVELTSVLSEQIALEIDQEILKDLISGATAGERFWSRKSGQFVNTANGVPLTEQASFTGTVSEWYETLVEVINDVSADIHRKTLRGGANFLVCGPEVANVLEFTSGFRASVTHDDDKGTVGNYKDGSINKKWDLYVDPYFPRNVILVGRKGSSFLESGYVYAPYVPLQTTPTIFGPEDFTPRKGVMTRYGKKMVRPDMYGLVIVQDLNVN